MRWIQRFIKVVHWKPLEHMIHARIDPILECYERTSPSKAPTETTSNTWLAIVKGFTWQWRRNFTSIWILYRERRIKESFLVKTNPDKIKLLFSTQTITTKKNTLKREEEHYTRTKQTYNSKEYKLIIFPLPKLLNCTYMSLYFSNPIHISMTN